MYNHDVRFDFFRGISILLVMLLHAAFLMPNVSELGTAITQVLQRMSVGIPFFFVLSGYLVFSSFHRLAKHGKNGIFTYFTKRLSKIAPLYFIFIIINFIIFKTTEQYLPSFTEIQRNYINQENLTINNLLIHLFFLQGFIPEYVHSLLDGSWSIVVEVYFYILLPLFIYKITATAKSSYNLFIVLLLISMLAFSYFHELNKYLPLYYGKYTDGYSYYYFLTHIPEFIIGIVIFHLERSQSALDFSLQYRWQLVFTSIILFLGLMGSGSFPLAPHYLYAIAFGLLIFGSNFLFNYQHTSLIVRSISILGKQCYALFFTHMVVMRATSFVFQKFQFSENAFIFLSLNIIIGIGVSFLLSNFIFNRIDIYFLKKGNTFSRKYFPIQS